MSTRRSDQSSQEYFPPPASVGLGVETDLQAALPCSRVISVAEGSVVTTPSRPDYRDGNMLYLRERPSAADRWEWRAEQALAEHLVGHVQIAWEEPLGVQPLRLSGPFQTAVDVVMSRSVARAEQNAGEQKDVAFTSVESDDDLDRVVELIETCAGEEPSSNDFARWYAGEIRTRVRRGSARWFAMRDGENVVASAGLVVTDRGLRFQEVQTHPQARRKGWATRLLTSMLQQTDGDGDRKFVIVAERDSPAERLYRQLGFEPTSQLVKATAVGSSESSTRKTR